MAKILNGYALANAQTISSRTSNIGSGTVDTNTDTVSVTDIKMSEIKTALNETTNELYHLTISSSVNKDSWYGPYNHSVNGSTKRIVHTLKAVDNTSQGYRMGDFAGYDHLAESIGHSLKENNTNVEYWNGDNITNININNTVNLNLGQLDIDGMYNSTANQITTQVFDGTTLLLTESVPDYTDGTDYEHGFPTFTTLHAIKGMNHLSIPIDESYDGKTFTVKSFVDAGDGQNTPVCYLGDDLNWGISVNKKIPSVSYELYDENNDGSPDWSFYFTIPINGSDNSDVDYIFKYSPTATNKLTIEFSKVFIEPTTTSNVFNGNVTITLRWYPDAGHTQQPVILQLVINETVSNGVFDYQAIYGNNRVVYSNDIDLDQNNELILDIN